MIMASGDYAVFLGNLRSDIRIGALKQNLIHLLHQIGITVNKHEIDITNKPHSVYAFVYLASDQERQTVLDFLNSADILKSLNLSEIVEKGRKFKVAHKLERWQLTGQNSVSNVPNGTVPRQSFRAHSAKSSEDAAVPRTAAQSVKAETNMEWTNYSTVPMVTVTNPPPQDPRKTYVKVTKKPQEEHYYVKREKSASLFATLHKNRPYYGLSDSDPEPFKVNGTVSNDEKHDDEDDSKSHDTSTLINLKKSKKRNNLFKKKRLAPKEKNGSNTDNKSDMIMKNDNGDNHIFHRDVYILDEILGNESRILEFKRGQGMYVHRQLAKHVAMYTSAFLNSEGGTLLIGVSDNGEVKGVEMEEQLEDQLRQDIDTTIKRITPNIFPAMYKVHFVPVTDSRSQDLGNRKVIEVSVVQGISSQLYQTPWGEVYVRRDGSVQGPLKAAEIQDWIRMMMHDEQRKKDNEISNLREKERCLLAQLEEKRANEERLLLQLQNQQASTKEEEPPQQEDETKDSKSKVCVVL